MERTARSPPCLSVFFDAYTVTKVVHSNGTKTSEEGSAGPNLYARGATVLAVLGSYLSQPSTPGAAALLTRA